MIKQKMRDIKLWGDLLEIRIGKIIRLIFFYIVCSVIMSCKPLLFGCLIDNLMIPNKMILLIAFVVIFEVLGNILSFWTQRIEFKFVVEIEANVKKRIFEKILDTPYDKFVTVEKGSLVNTLQRDAEVFSRILSLLISIGVEITSTVSVAVIMFCIHWKLTLLLFIIFPINMYIFGRYGVKIKEKTKKSKKITDQYITFLNEILTNMKTIKIFHVNQFAKDAFGESIAKNYHALDQRNEFNRKGSLIIQLINSFSGCLILIFGIEQIYRGILSIGGFVSFRSYSATLNGYLLQLSRVNADFQEIKVSLERVQSIIEVTEKSTDSSQGEIKEIHYDGNIRLQEVSFGYDQNNKILKHITMSFEENKITSVIGQNGCGKSTLLNLISLLYRNYEGEIYIGDHEIRDFSNDCFRKEVCSIFQQTTLFSLSLRDNLLLGNQEISVKRIEEVCKEVFLWDFIRSLPMGLDTMIGDKGILLSEGQKQKMVIARGLLSDAKILLLDEITANLDVESEEQICRLLGRIKRNRYIINVSHRKRLLEISDTIYEVTDGILTKVDHFIADPLVS